MTKTLTEQWREGKLQEGEYFAITTWSDEIRPLSFYGDCFLDTEVPLDNSVIVEVLAPVPSYDEYKRLQERNEKLEKMAFHYTPEEWNTMMRMVERLQEQLNEANNIIVKADWDCDYTLQSKCGFSDYLKKYDVKGVK